MSTEKDRAPTPQWVNWKALREWVAGKEAWEREHPNQPAPLSPHEAQAVALLLPPPLVETEPDLKNKNWIGLLQRYVDAHRKTTGVVYSDTEQPFTSLDGQTVSRWVSWCKIGECAEKFPRSGYGMDRGVKMPPSFMKKKSARQFAARCAIEFLMEHNFMPRDGENVIVPKSSRARSSSSSSGSSPSQPLILTGAVAGTTKSPSTPLNNTVPAHSTSASRFEPQMTDDNGSSSMMIDDMVEQQPPPQQQQVEDEVKQSGGAPLHQPHMPMVPPDLAPTPTYESAVQKRSHMVGDATSGLGSGLSNAQRVANLCAFLGFPQPNYELQQHPDRHGLWSGRALFDDSRVPTQGLGQAQDMASKRDAMERVMEGVLRWLVGYEEKRRKTADAILGLRGPVSLDKV